MKRALITGSETFGKYLTNPSKWLAVSVNGQIVSGYHIHSLVFPSVILAPQGIENPGEIIVRTAQEMGAGVIISFGMASAAKAFRLERSATNWIYNEKYLSTIENNRLLDFSRPEKEQIQTDLSQWDTKKMQMLFARANLPLESVISDDPGQYSCNSWMYRTLRAMKKSQLKIPYLFVHHACSEAAIELIPDFDRANKILIKNEDMLKALEIILKSLKS